MKTKYLLLGAILSFFGLTANAQVYDMYYQGFESGEAVTYSGTPAANVRGSSNVRSSGNKAIKLVQASNEEVELVLDTIDFTQNTTLRYIAVRFDHICRVPQNSAGDIAMAKIYYKRANQTTWTSMSAQQYNQTGPHSSDFSSTTSFMEQSYDNWYSADAPTVNNEQWHSERFDLDNVMTSAVPVNERKLMIKFVLRRRTISGTLDTNNTAWWIDNIKISASADRMVSPTITMLEYPNVMYYPNSRGAHIELQATTSVSAGINPDSVYIIYKGGSDPTQHQLMMTRVPGTTNRFEGRIPFYGFDTLMHFYTVVCDSTSNANKMTFPATEGAWVQYRCVRGKTEQPGLLTPGFTSTSTSNFYPFPDDADHRCEFVYDSVLMREAGYGPGAITSFRFKIGGGGVLSNRVHSRFQIRMKNVPNSYALQLNERYKYSFTTEAMQIVYDSVFTIPTMPANLYMTITLQDTFFYAGSDMLLQITYDGNADYPAPVTIPTIPVAESKSSLYFFDGDASLGYNAFTSSAFSETLNSEQKRPAFIFTETSLPPLRFDAGISELVDPSYDVPMTDRPDSITVKLKNYGDQVMNAIRISYTIDDNVNGYYDWTGNLAGGADTNVIIATNINLVAGFHTLTVWVEDTLTSGGQQYRDHEPYNDTMSTQFVVCDGPMHGIRNIGGASPHFNSIEEFLFSLSRCGIDDTLIVRLAAGNYPAFTMPVVPGVSESNYIVFEPRSSASNARPVIYSDESNTLSSIVNLEQTSNIRFRNINFVRIGGPLTDMVTLGGNSVNCRFEGCVFNDMLLNPVASLRINSLLNSGNADSLFVDTCTFTGGNIAVNAKGPAPDDYAMGLTVKRSSFTNQYSNAIKVEYMGKVLIADNTMMDVLSNGSYVVLLNGSSNGVNVERNKIYTSHGAGAMAVTDVTGTSDVHALVANNMIVSDDDGTANQLTTALNVIQGNWIDVVYNSVKLNAPTRINVAAATFGGGSLQNSRFINNIIASTDNTNYAFSYQPLTSTSNMVGHNNYFSNGVVLNRRSTSSYTSLAAWQAAVPGDSTSVSVNPNFLNMTLIDLRTYNRNIKGVGLPVPAVTTDIYGNLRGAVATCPGAYEFSSLPYDFEPEALISPVADTCNMPESVELVVRMRNSGIQVLDTNATNPLHLYCRVNNGTVHSVTINDSIPADDTVTIHTGHMLNLPSGTSTDATYTLRVWCTQANDPNQINDTNVFTVLSRYHPAAPADITDSVDYSDIDTITPTVGVNTWQVYGNAGAPRRPSQLFWYLDSNDTEPFYIGPTYITDPMQQDAEFYLRQRRAMPIVRMTQLELVHSNNAVGLTSPMPLWMLSARKVALQLTNIGDATAYLEGDTLMTVSPTAGMNAKYYTFGNVKIEPGQSLVVQFAQNNVETDSNVTIVNNSMGNTGVAYNANIAFIYKRNGVVEDALPLNSVITTASTQEVNWANMNVPNYVWNGAGLTITANTVAGAIRTGFNGGVGDWDLATSAAPMFISRTNPDWMMYEDNGCEADMATVRVIVREPPAVDIHLSSLETPDVDCGLGYEDVTLKVSNYGGDTVSDVVLHYSAGNNTVTDTIVGIILPHSDTVFTFGSQINLVFGHDTVITLRVWADSVDVDPIHENDTIEAAITSLYTPDVPAAVADRVVPYATNDTISIAAPSGMIPVWYGYNMEPVDTGYTHISEILYGPGTRGVAYIMYSEHAAQVGTGLTTNSNTAFPSPYQSNNKFAKQQYMYTAHDLRNGGLDAGLINTISFYFDTMTGSTASVSFQNYTISLGTTTDTIFTSNSDWHEAPEVVFQRDVFTLTQDDDHDWVTHQLSTPFAWDGESTLVVQISYELNAAVTTGMRTRYTAKANTTIYKNQNNALTPSTAEYVGGGARSGNRPNALFTTLNYGCEGPMTTYNVTLNGMPQYDAAIFWADGFDTLVYNSCDTINLPLKMRNQGGETIDTLVLYYYLDDLAVDSTVIIDSFAASQMYDLSLFSKVMSPGRHSVTAIVSTYGDSITSNDTIRGMFMVRFCGGNYTIAANDATADYPSFGAAIDTLNVVGVLGPVSFLVSPGTYNEQVVLNNIEGSSDVNTISFVGQADSVLLTAATSQADNYVMKIDGASNVTIDNIMMEARPTIASVKYANVLVLLNDSNVHVNNCYLKVKGTILDNNASCIVLQGNVADLTINGTVTDSGYYAFRTVGTTGNYSNFHFTNNIFRSFTSGGIYIRDISRVIITQNEILSGNSTDSRGLTGIYLASTTDSLVIQKNKIYLVDERKGAKRGIQLENVVGTAIAPAFLVNNMIGTHGTDSKGLPNINNKAASAGIVVDSGSVYVSMIYNSIRVRGSNVNSTSTTSQLNTANDLSYGIWCGATASQLSVMNNIISNFSYGYAYFLTSATNITTSDYNAFYTEGTKQFAWNGTTNIGTLSDFQTLSGIDGMSVFEEPFFMANNDLHLTMTNFATKAQYNPDVIEDIDGNTRPPIGPTIGAHEKDRLVHDMAVVRIYKPELPININNPSNVESDSVKVVASFHNNGLSNETNVQWYAYIEGHESQTLSVTRNLGTFIPAQMKQDSVMVPSPLGIIDTQIIHVVVIANNDMSLDDNEMRNAFYLAPAFNISAELMEYSSAYQPQGCRMYETEIRIKVKNSGSKDFPSGTTFKIGYHTELYNPSNIVVPTLPDTVEQLVSLPTILPIGSEHIFTFDTPANLYPTNNFVDIKVRVRGWAKYEFDIVTANDTTALNNTKSPLVDSYFSPAPPEGHDTTLAYGTWGAVTAEQENSRPIRWYRDTTAAHFFTGNNYNLSRVWNNTPQFFHDSVYYLNALSTHNCPSYFSPVQVSVAPRKTRDVAVEFMLAPLGNRVYMENDTVRVQIANYGTSAQSNFPITYRLKRGNNIIQEVTDTVRDNIAPDQTYIFTFDTLLNIPTPLTSQNYTLSVWTDLTNDATPRNDTLRVAHPFSSLAETQYNTFNGEVPRESGTIFDITRVSFNGIDLQMPPIDRDYTNLASYSSPDYPVLHVTRGTTDSLFIQVSPIDPTEQNFRCRATVHIDYDRDGLFSTGSTCNEAILDGVAFWGDSTLSTVITIPECASLGYMRMRVKVMGYAPESTDGHIVDFLLFVDEEAPESDLAITQIVTPRSYMIKNYNPTTVRFRMANKGSTPITSADIYYSFMGARPDSSVTDMVQWVGNLMPGQSTVVALPEYIFPLGTSTLTIWHDMMGDVDSTNNRLEYEYHHFRTVRLVMRENFDNNDNWYAPRGYTEYTHNFWQRGMPNKAFLDSAYSGDYAWVTDLNNNVVTGKRGSISYLYSPIIDISQIRPDTISVRIRHKLTNGSKLRLEFYNYGGLWVPLQCDTILTWYNDMDEVAFTGNSSSSEGYKEYWINTVSTQITGDFQEKLQFRFAYITPTSTSATASYSEGCAIDDFYIGRAQRRVDAGVVAITKPVNPCYGQTLYPEVVVKNYGLDTLRNIQIGYTHYGSYLAKLTDIECSIGPGDLDTFAFDSPFIVTSDYPDTFNITAFTYRSDDIYRDNDSVTSSFSLSPLDNDISAEEFLSPLANVVAGDTAVHVTMRLRNFGFNPISQATVTYIVNNVTRVDEEINFDALMGRPLQSLEYYNYTFHRKITAPLGVMSITAYVKSPNNDYIYNDTITMRSEGIMSITDLAATAIIVDDSADHNFDRIALIIDNVGARGVNNFEVGYWIDNDTTNMVRETYYRAQPLAALNTGYYVFDHELPKRSSGYNIVSAFVHVDNDNDPSNDTTEVFASRFIDVEVIKVLVEENASNDCRVLVELRNNGNVAVKDQQLRVRAAINGGDSILSNFDRRIDPSEVFHVELNRRIPKSPTRQYVGTGWIRKISGDLNQDNDQTSIVEVINYFENTPSVNRDQLVLEQNYPNPFSQQTTIPFSIPNAAQVRFFIMDAMGRIVHRADKFYQAGSHVITIDMDSYTAGVYYYGIEVDGQRQMRKMVLK